MGGVGGLHVLLGTAGDLFAGDVREERRHPNRKSTPQALRWYNLGALARHHVIVTVSPSRTRRRQMDRKMDRTAVTKVSLHASGSDAAYWRTRPPEERLETVEIIRREYHGWPEAPDDEDIPRLQRVYRVCKRT